MSNEADKKSPPEQFIDAARAVSLGDADRLAFPPGEILRIIRDPALRRELVTLFDKKIQDPETRRIIKGYIAELLVEEEHEIENHETLADGITRFVGRPALAVTGAGIVTLAGGVTLGGLTLLSGGLVSVVAVGGGWTYLKLRANRNKKETKRLKRLLDELDNL